VQNQSLTFAQDASLFDISEDGSDFGDDCGDLEEAAFFGSQPMGAWDEQHSQEPSEYMDEFPSFEQFAQEVPGMGMPMGTDMGLGVSYPSMPTMQPSLTPMQSHFPAMPQPMPHQNAFGMNYGLALADPFDGASIEQHFHAQFAKQAQAHAHAHAQPMYAPPGLPSRPLYNQIHHQQHQQMRKSSNPPAPRMPSPKPEFLAATAPPNPKQCSVCARRSVSLAVLSPCAHPLCSACLTSALNIVGEKDMQCAVCRRAVTDFKLVVVSPASSEESSSVSGSSNEGERPALGARDVNQEGMKGKSFFEPMWSSPGSSVVEGLAPPVRASTPKKGTQVKTDGSEIVVLRIDNVPWVGLVLPIRT
jgi:hypothetical protein